MKEPKTKNSGDSAPKPVDSWKLISWLWRNYLKPHSLLLVPAVFFMVIEGSMFGALSYMMKPMFDRIFVGGQENMIPLLGFAFLAIFAVRGVSSIAQKVILQRLSQLTVADIRRDLLRHIIRLDSKFHQKHGPGYLMQRVEGDVNAVSGVWNAVITGAGRDIMSVIALFGVAIAIDWKWTLIACLGIPVLVMPSLLIQRFVRANAGENRRNDGRLNTRLSEIFIGILPIKLNGLEEYQADKYEELTQNRIRLMVKGAFGKSALPGMIDIMSGVGFMLVLYWGGREILSGEKTVGDFVAFFTAIGMAFEPLRRLGGIGATWQAAAAGIERMRKLLMTEPKLKDPATPVAPPQGVPEIVLDDVTLAYGKSAVLDGTSFVAEAGKTTALVGASGAGKSTVFNALTRLYDPKQGQITIGGVSVKDMNLTDLRGLFSVVSQEALLFDDTLRENVLLGKSVDDAKLNEALDAAHVSEFAARLPDGLEAPVGPRGTNLSGGQRQRVAIARALLRDTPILLLDEATSALDSQSEKLVQEALDRLSVGRTTIVIAHRLATVRNADKIVVMDQGRVVEQGSHDELIARGGAYARLHALQFGDDGAEVVENS